MVMELKRRGKISPSPNGEYLSVLKLLPAAVFAIASVLSLEDRQVLAYMITNSIKTTSAKTTNRSNSSKKCENGTHKAHVFGCDCFDCYTIYWFKWDSSPNRHLIHQAIEAFEEERLTKAEISGKSPRTTKKRVKSSRRVADSTPVVVSGRPEKSVPVIAEDNSPCLIIDFDKVELPGNDVASSEEVTVEKERKEITVRMTMSCHKHNKGLARKVLPDVLGLFNSRLWNLWGPDLNGCDYPCH